MSVASRHLVRARRAGGLPQHHRDPFDRMLIAQALGEELTIVTAAAAVIDSAVGPS